MIRTAHVLNGLTHEECYMKGYLDGTPGDTRLAQRSDEAHRDLEVILDRLNAIEPAPHLDSAVLFDGDAA